MGQSDNSCDSNAEGSDESELASRVYAAVANRGSEPEKRLGSRTNSDQRNMKYFEQNNLESRTYASLAPVEDRRQQGKIRNMYYNSNLAKRIEEKPPRLFSLVPPKKTVTNPYAVVIPCSVRINRLSEGFIADAIMGKIDWSHLKSKNKILDYELYHNDKLKEINLSNNLSALPENSSKEAGTLDHGKKSRKSKERSRKVKKVTDLPEKEWEEEEIKETQESSDNVEYQPVESQGRELRKRGSRTCKKLKLLSNKKSPSSRKKVDILLPHSGLQKLECQNCNLTFENKFEFRQHNYEVHNPPVELKNHIVYGCKICKPFFDDEATARYHVLSHRDASYDRKFACLICQSKFSKEITLENHLIAKHLYFKCTFCEYLGSTFDVLENHCRNAHAGYGKPYSCNLCDYRSSSYGAQVAHRKTIHGLEREGDHERCILCAYLLASDKEIILEHLAGHVGIQLFECKYCENFKSNSFFSMRDHGINLHASSDIASFTKMTDFQLVTDRLKSTIALRISKPQEKCKNSRVKPTFAETKDAIAGICSPDVSPTDNTIPASSIDVINQTWLSPSCKSPFSLSNTNCQKELESLSKTLDTSCKPTDTILDMGSSDTLTLAMQSLDGLVDPDSDLTSSTEAVLSVDLTTGQLFSQGLPVLDEEGNTVFVSIAEAEMEDPVIDKNGNSTDV